MFGVVIFGMIGLVRGEGETGCDMQDGWVIRRAEELVVGRMMEILRAKAAEMTKEYKEAKRMGQGTKGHRVLHGRTARLLRVTSQLQSVMIRMIKNKRF